MWCLRYQNADFSKYFFVDETSVRKGDIPIYHWRKAQTYPEAFKCSDKFSGKVNVWGGISFKGASKFAVFFKKINFYDKFSIKKISFSRSFEKI